MIVSTERYNSDLTSVECCDIMRVYKQCIPKSIISGSLFKKSVFEDFIENFTAKRSRRDIDYITRELE